MLGLGCLRGAPWETDKTGMRTAGSRRSNLSDTLPKSSRGPHWAEDAQRFDGPSELSSVSRRGQMFVPQANPVLHVGLPRSQLRMAEERAQGGCMWAVSARRLWWLWGGHGPPGETGGGTWSHCRPPSAPRGPDWQGRFARLGVSRACPGRPPFPGGIQSPVP